MEEHSPFAKSVSVSTIFINTSISTTITRYLLPGGRVHPSSAYFLYPNQWENLARIPGNVFPGRETLLAFRGTFSQAGKPCSVSGGHFPERENLAALVGNVSPGRKTLPRSWGTFSRAGKPCRAPRQHLYRHGNLAAFCGRVSTINCSPPSFPIRSLQGVCDTPLQLAAKNLHETMPPITASPTNK